MEYPLLFRGKVKNKFELMMNNMTNKEMEYDLIVILNS